MYGEQAVGKSGPGRGRPGNVTTGIICKNTVDGAQ